MNSHVITVTGPIDASEMGFTLPHEHVMVDFAGADTAGKHRYDPKDVIATMKPLLAPLREQGVVTFVDCTPMYLARDPAILRELSRDTGLKILTNTGQYKEPFLPPETFEGSAEQVADTWIQEATEGIEGTDIRPGFIKTAVNPGPLIPIQQKVTKAAALTSRATGLTIATHTGFGVPAMEVLDILEATGVEPRKWIFVHAQNEEDLDRVLQVARRGAWIELDGIQAGTEEKHLRSLMALLDGGFESQVMLSHDAGWYTVGEEPGAKKRSYTHLMDDFIPRMRNAGVTDDVIHTLTVANPARAFAVG